MTQKLVKIQITQVFESDYFEGVQFTFSFWLNFFLSNA